MKPIKLLSLFLFVFTAYACNEIKQPTQVETEIVSVSLSLISADVMMDDEPLSKAGDSDDTYLVSVQEFNANISAYEPYAWGIFSSTNNITIDLTKGNKYYFQVTLFKDYFALGKKVRVTDYAWSGVDDIFDTATNQFKYEKAYIHQQPKSSTEGDIFYGVGGYSSFFLGDSFYGSVNDYVAQANNKLEISISRTSAFAEIKIIGLKDGRIVVELGGNSKEIVYPNDSFSTWITDSYYLSGSTFRSNISFKYYDSSNNEKVLFDESVSFKRSYRKNINLNISYSSDSNISSNLSINASDQDLVADTPLNKDVNI